MTVRLPKPHGKQIEFLRSTAKRKVIRAGRRGGKTFNPNRYEKKIIAEVKRDCEMAKENDIRGVDLSTAGSINNGSLLKSMRLVMETICEYGKY